MIAPISTLRTLVLALLLAAMASQVTLANEELKTKVVGMWQEFHPGDNLVYFAKDGTWKLFLKKGEIGDERALNGTWKISKEGVLTVVVKVGDKEQKDSTQVRFEGDEMVLSSKSTKETRHRRHTGPIPERFNW
jgi:uncharacterized protein (TIGR03066 family)